MVENDMVSKTLLHSKVAGRLYQYIKENKLEPGDRLPGERQLAAKWNVGRSTLREAIKELESQGIVTAEIGKGTYLTDEMGSSTLLIRLASKNFLDLFEIKTVLERYILQKLVSVIQEEQLQKLEGMALQMNAIAAAGIMPEEQDNRFHEYLMSCYENHEMANIVVNMIKAFPIFTGDIQKYYDDENFDYASILRGTIPYHLEMVEMMRKRDVRGTLGKYDKITEYDLKVYKRMF